MPLGARLGFWRRIRWSIECETFFFFFFFFCHYSFNLDMNNMYNIYRISPMGVKSAGLMMLLSVFGLFILG